MKTLRYRKVSNLYTVSQLVELGIFVFRQFGLEVYIKLHLRKYDSTVVE